MHEQHEVSEEASETLSAGRGGSLDDGLGPEPILEEESSAEWDRRVYKYGCLAPTTNKHLVFEQMRRAHRYRNFLTEIERERRIAVRAVIGDGKDSPEERKRKKPILTAIDERALLLRKGARATCGTFWGTYQLMEEADDRSRKALGIFDDPRFIRWTGDGVVSVQLTGVAGRSPISRTTRRCSSQTRPRSPGWHTSPSSRSCAYESARVWDARPSSRSSRCASTGRCHWGASSSG